MSLSRLASIMPDEPDRIRFFNDLIVVKPYLISAGVSPRGNDSLKPVPHKVHRRPIIYRQSTR